MILTLYIALKIKFPGILSSPLISNATFDGYGQTSYTLYILYVLTVIVYYYTYEICEIHETLDRIVSLFFEQLGLGNRSAGQTPL